ncbi:putative Holliday junction resolvase domain protein [Synechococcus sp. MIT S9220]|nr:putative Holliday junction resolvase domain protein [Synechococcus sp. MIT S9220]
MADIVIEVATLQCFEWSDSQSKAVAACEPDPSTADIKAEC